MEEAEATTRVKAGWSTPLLHVRSIERSIPFYERLGFEVIDTDRCDPLGWARLHCEGGALMFVRDPGDGPPIDPEAQTVLFYLYTPNLAALRGQLVAAGIAVSELRYPNYMPGGEVALTDPDGYMLLIGHWGEKEHTAWLERIGRSPER